MFFNSRSRKRKQLLAAPVNADEHMLARQSLWQFHHLPGALQESLVRWCRVLIAEKSWEGCRGLKLTDNIRWTIAASAALCVPPNSDWYFDKTETILVYPEAYVAEVRPGVHSNFELSGEFARSGQTVYRGPIIVNWQDVQSAARGPNRGHSLAIHEFAHQIDMVNGPNADGLPPLANDVDSVKWNRAMQTELDYARQMVAQGHRVYINDYGLSSPSEFFAVASEYYFQTPHELYEYHPGVYARLREFYRTDLREFLPQDSTSIIGS